MGCVGWLSVRGGLVAEAARPSSPSNVPRRSAGGDRASGPRAACANWHGKAIVGASRRTVHSECSSRRGRASAHFGRHGRGPRARIRCCWNEPAARGLRLTRTDCAAPRRAGPRPRAPIAGTPSPPGARTGFRSAALRALTLPAARRSGTCLDPRRSAAASIARAVRRTPSGAAARVPGAAVAVGAQPAACSARAMLRSCSRRRNSWAVSAPHSAIVMSICASHGSPCVPSHSGPDAGYHTLTTVISSSS